MFSLSNGALKVLGLLATSMNLSEKYLASDMSGTERLNIHFRRWKLQAVMC